MYLLVNLEGHLSQMGEIIAGLVNQYSVPISIVDKVEKVCPKCSVDEKEKPSGSDSSSSPLLPLQLKPSTSPHDESDLSLGKTTLREAMGMGLGRRSAAKYSALVRALEKKFQPEPPEEVANASSNSSPPFADIVPLVDTSNKTLEMITASTSDTNVSDHSEEQPSSTSGFLMNVKSESGESSAENNGNGNGESDMVNTAMEALHPNLLACLISATPNVFANGRSTSPLASGPPSDPTQDHPPAIKRPKMEEVDFEKVKMELGLSMDNSNCENKESVFNNYRSPGSLGFSVTATGKVRRGRIVYNARDLDILENFYQQDANACADPLKKKQLMELLGVDAIRLKVWFQNRRRKDRIQWLKDNGEDSPAPAHLNETV